MLSSLALPCLPNHELVYTKMSSASVCIEAEGRVSVNDHEHHCRNHHHRHHYHHHRYCRFCFRDFSSPFIAAKEANSSILK